MTLCFRRYSCPKEFCHAALGVGSTYRIDIGSLSKGATVRRDWAILRGRRLEQRHYVAFRKLFNAAALSGVALITVFSLVSAQAESLAEAMRSAYRNNPTLEADRARQRGTDELVPAAKSGWRPTVNSTVTGTQEWSNTDITQREHNASLKMSITLSQPIFRGFKTVEGIAAAKSNVEAGRQQLLSTEQTVLFNVAAAYLAVVRDRQILAIRQQNVSNLQKQANAANARFQAGEVTRTDVSQARARVSGAQGDVASAKANLEGSIAAYTSVVGHKPGKLKYTRLGKTPSSLNRALSTAQEINPRILAAAFVRDASLHDVEVAKGDLLPELNVTAQGSRTEQPQKGFDWSESASISGVLSIPIYQGGREYATIRQSKQTSSQRTIQIIEAVRAVREQVTSAWYNLVSSAQAIASAKSQVAAAALALDGINQEYSVGSRTTIDVLNAQQEVLSARLGQINAEYSQMISSYQLLQAMGKLTARHLGLGGDYYDPRINYDDVKNKWFGTHILGEE
jgi:outer membrane protein